VYDVSRLRCRCRCRPKGARRSFGDRDLRRIFSVAISRELASLFDLIYFDLKVADPREHQACTGRDNSRIFGSLALLARCAADRLRVRIPVVPGVTLSEGNFAGLIRQLRTCGLHGAILLPYNPLGLQMAMRLQRDQPRVMKRAQARGCASVEIVAQAEAPTRRSSTKFMTAAEFADATTLFERIARAICTAEPSLPDPAQSTLVPTVIDDNQVPVPLR